MAMRPLVMGRLVLVLGVLLAGCVTRGKVTLSLGMDTMTAAEQEETATIEQAIQVLCGHMEANGYTCKPPKVIIVRDGQTPTYWPEYNNLLFPRRALNLRNRAVIAHELAHWGDIEARVGCTRSEQARIACEQWANYLSIRILMQGLELPRFRGHPMVGAERSVHDTEEPSAVPSSVSAADDRVGPARPDPGAARARV